MPDIRKWKCAWFGANQAILVVHCWRSHLPTLCLARRGRNCRICRWNFDDIYHTFAYKSTSGLDGHNSYRHTVGRCQNRCLWTCHSRLSHDVGFQLKNTKQHLCLFSIETSLDFCPPPNPSTRNMRKCRSAILGLTCRLQQRPLYSPHCKLRLTLNSHGAILSNNQHTFPSFLFSFPFSSPLPLSLSHFCQKVGI